MNTNKLKFYFALSRLPLLQKSYALKVMVIAFLGCLVPLFTLIVYLLLNFSISLSDKVTLLLVVLLATLVWTTATLFLLYLLLEPITLTSTALYQYLNKEQKPKLPTGFEDVVGNLMTYVQYTIEKLDLLNRSLNFSATIDPLTGIPNRRAGEERLRQDVARARRDENQMLVALIDIDEFKNINEKYGHHLGDVCLTQIVECLSKNIREGDWLARWDGDKFLLVLWNFNHTTPTVVLKRIQQQSVKTHIGEILQISLSIGACEYKGNTDLDIEIDLRTLLICVNDALSQVKPAGHGGIVLGESQRSSLFI
jgi:diguanylate cyclase (GGDEF)-like protein